MTWQSRIAVSGFGLATPLGLSAAETWDRCLPGESAIGPLNRFDVSGHACTAAATAPDFDLSASLRLPKNQKFMNRSVLLAARALLEAVAASGADLAGLDSSRIALHVGSGQIGPEAAEFLPALAIAAEGAEIPDYARLGGRASRLIDRYFPLRTLSNSGVGLLSSEIGARGPGTNFVQSDTASALAIEAACHDLLEGRCDIAFAGGYDSLVNVSTYLSYEKAGLLSPSAPDQAGRPFDKDRDGLVLGEGAAFLALERMDDAERRGAAIRGEIAGCGSAMDSSDSLQPSASLSTLRAALNAAGDVAAGNDAAGNDAASNAAAGHGDSPGFLIARGIGTPDGDRSEAALLASLFGRDIPVTALKGGTGYLGAATAAVEACLALLSLEHRKVPPIARLRCPDADCALDLVAREPRGLPEAASTALCVSWSWAGHCVLLRLRAFPGRDGLD